MDCKFAFYGYEEGIKCTHLVYKEDSPTCYCCIHSHFQEQSWRVRSYPKEIGHQRGGTSLYYNGTVEWGVAKAFFFYDIFCLAK